MAVPKDVTESSLLVGPEPPPSQRQKRAPLTPVQLLARRGYLTPKDVMYMFTPERMGASQSARPSSAAATPSPRAARASYTAATPPPKQRPASASLP